MELGDGRLQERGSKSSQDRKLYPGVEAGNSFQAQMMLLNHSIMVVGMQASKLTKGLLAVDHAVISIFHISVENLVINALA